MKKHIPLFIFLVVFLSLNIFKVGTDVRPFFDWDESIYAQVGKEMIKSKSYLVPLWQGRAWLDKPPVPSLMYGVMTLIPEQNEISMRVLTVVLSSIALTLLYIFAYRYSKSIFVSLGTIIITSFLPAYLQRSQSLNVDVFLLIGWLGYVLWYRKRWVGTFFLTFAVLSKSLLGYYPVAMIFLYELLEFLLNKKKRKKEFAIYIKNTVIQVAISSLWFFGMYYQFRDDFIQYHFVDSHFKRVTSSIEQHFGQRTFYIDLLLEQLKYGIIPVVVSTLFLSYLVIKKKSTEAFFSIIFVPWFLFLNLTKTKIAWYLYPVLPQFVYLALYMIRFIKKPMVQGLVLVVVLWSFFTFMIPITSYITTDFSKLEDHQQIALEAKKEQCKLLIVLVNESTRSSYATLKSVDLVIHTTTWWGNHPSMAYYSDAKTSFDYMTSQFKDDINKLPVKTCFISENQDWMSGWQLKEVASNKTFTLGIRE